MFDSNVWVMVWVLSESQTFSCCVIVLLVARLFPDLKGFEKAGPLTLDSWEKKCFTIFHMK
jgi:hypothetical protein